MEHCRPVETVKADDVLPDEVEPLGGPLPVALVGLSVVGKAERRDVVAEGVDPDVEDVIGLLGNGNPPLHPGPADGEVLEALADHAQDLVLSRLGPNEEPVGRDELPEPVLVGREAKEEVLLLGPLARALVVGTDVVGLLELVLVLERLAARAVPAGVGALVDGVLAIRRPGAPEALPELQDASAVLLFRRADEAVVANVERLPEGPEDGGDLVAVLLLRDPPFPGDPLDVLPVLVGSREEEDVVAGQASRPGEGVGGDGGVGVAHVRNVVDVVDGRRDEVGPLLAHRCFPPLRQAARASASTCLTATFLSSAAR